MPIIEGAVQRGAGVELGPGADFYVNKDAGNASDGNGGGAWEDPLATIQEGVDRCTSGAGDRVNINVASSAYAEAVTVTSKDYVSLIGHLNESAWGRPDIWPASGSGLVVSLSQGFSAKRIYFGSDDNDAAKIDSEGWGLQDCKFQGSSDGLLLKGHATNDSYGAGQGLADRCTFEANGASGIRFEHANLTSGIGSWGNQIRRSTFRDNVGADLLSAVGASGGGAGIFLALQVHGNWFQDSGAAHVYMDMDQGVAGDLAANSGIISGNWFADDALIAAQCDISGQPKVYFIGNYDALGLVDGSAFND